MPCLCSFCTGDDQIESLPPRAYEGPMIVLASASPRRSMLLESADIQFACLVPNVDESLICADDPGELAASRASLKSHAALELLAGDDSIPILACDTVVALDGEIFGKPSSEEDAHRMLLRLSGRSHVVLSGVSILYKGSETRFFESTCITFKDMSPEEIDGYIATGEPMDKAGAYGLQGIGGTYISSIEGDHNNVIGLPLDRVQKELQKLAAPSPTAYSKSSIRKLMKTVRKNIPVEDRVAYSKRVCSSIAAHPKFDKASVIAAYVPFGSEVLLESMFERLRGLAKKKQLAIPCTMQDRRMEFVYVEPEEILSGESSLEFITDPANITQIPDSRKVLDASEIDLMIVPGVAFDDMGIRLGYGGGYYDTYMSRPGFDAFTVGAFFYEQQFHGKLPSEAYDKSMAAIATQYGVCRTGL